MPDDEITMDEVKAEVKKWFTSKTVWIGMLTIMAGIIEYMVGLPEGAAAGTIIIGVVNIVIRFLTRQPLGK